MITIPKTLTNCVLREFTAADADAFAAIEYDRDVKKYVGDGIPKRAKEKFLAEFDQKLDLLPYAVESLDGRLAGRASIDRCEIRGERTITIVLAKDFQGQGIGPTLARYLIDCYFSDERGIAIRAEVHQDNAPSLRLLTSLGFEDTGETNEIGHSIYRVSRTQYLEK